MSLNFDFLDIPEDLNGHLPCATQSHLFTDSRLDIDFDDDSYLLLSSDEQHTLLAEKQAAETAAAAACQTCPLINECREWALNTRVFGVAGGLTDKQRAQMTGAALPEPVVDTAQRGSRGVIRDDLVSLWTSQGMSAAQIAERLHCNKRTVERRRNAIADHGVTFGVDNPTYVHVTIDENDARNHTADNGQRRRATDPEVIAARTDAATPKHTPAKRAINLTKVSPETLAMYRTLADGGLRDREEVITAATPYVDDATAEKWGKHTKGTPEQKIAAGRRKFIMNRLDIAIRRNRINAKKTDTNRVVLSLASDVRDAILTDAN